MAEKSESDGKPRVGRKTGMPLLAMQLAAGKTITTAAKEIGVSYSAARNWAAAEEFDRLLEEAKREVWELAKNRLRGLHSKAFDAVEEQLDDKKSPRLRLDAAKFVISTGRDMLAIDEMKQDIAELKALINESSTQPIPTGTDSAPDSGDTSPSEHQPDSGGTNSEPPNSLPADGPDA